MLFADAKKMTEEITKLFRISEIFLINLILKK